MPRGPALPYQFHGPQPGKALPFCLIPTLFRAYLLHKARACNKARVFVSRVTDIAQDKGIRI